MFLIEQKELILVVHAILSEEEPSNLFLLRNIVPGFLQGLVGGMSVNLDDLRSEYRQPEIKFTFRMVFSFLQGDGTIANFGSVLLERGDIFLKGWLDCFQNWS